MTQKSNISFRKQYHKFLHSHAGIFTIEERSLIRSILREYFTAFPAEGVAPGKSIADKIQIVEIILDEIGLGKAAVLSVLFHELVEKKTSFCCRNRLEVYYTGIIYY